jgi:hypothetical protein
MEKKACKRAAVSIGALLGNLKGVRLLGLLTEKGNYIWVPFSWIQRTLVLSLGGHMELYQGTELSWTDIKLWGTKDLFIRPRCFGTVWGSNPNANQSINQSINQHINWWMLLREITCFQDTTRAFAPHVATGSLKTLKTFHHMLLQEVSKH